MPSVVRSNNHLLQALPAAEFETLRPLLESIELVRETVLVQAGAALTHVCWPESGVIAMTARLGEGQTVEVAMAGRDGVVGALTALGDGISSTDVIVLLPGTASILDVTRFRAIVDRNASFRKLLVRQEQALIAQVQQSVACNASHPVEARLSRWLLRAREVSGSECLPVTQELLAKMIGVRRNAVSIVAHGLQQAGIISYSRGRIEITDLQGLRKTACECYHTVKVQCDRLLKYPA